MLMFTLAISCLTTSNLPWFLDLTGEGNGTPLQFSCLENPRDRGTWWAAVYGVAQSRTWLKWRSSSSSISQSQKWIWGRSIVNNDDFIYFYFLEKEITQFQKVQSCFKVKTPFYHTYNSAMHRVGAWVVLGKKKKSKQMLCLSSRLS